MNTVKKLQKIHEALNHMSKAVSLVEEAKNIDVSGVDYVKPDSERTSVLTVKVKTELSDETKHLLQDLAIREIDTEQIEQNVEAKAEELFYIFHTGDDTRSWERLVDKSGFHAIARHLATPQTDVQHALQAALESERELMDILRKIGKVFGKNVGTDIGILDLPKLVEGEVSSLQNSKQVVCEGRDNLFRWRNQLQCDLIDLIVEKKKCPRPRPGDHWGDDKILAELRELLSKPEPCFDCEGYKQNSLQIVRLNNWLQEHNLTKPGVCVTDTIIELLEKAVSPDKPRVAVNNHCVWTYEQLSGAGWTDEQMVEHGHAHWLPQPQSFQSRVMNAIHIKPELRAGMTEDRIIENLEILHRDAAGNFSKKHKIEMIKKDPQLHDLITHLPDFHNAVRVRYDIAHSCGDEDEVSYWRRQLDVVNKLLELTQ